MFEWSAVNQCKLWVKWRNWAKCLNHENLRKPYSWKIGFQYANGIGNLLFIFMLGKKHVKKGFASRFHDGIEKWCQNAMVKVFYLPHIKNLFLKANLMILRSFVQDLIWSWAKTVSLCSSYWSLGSTHTMLESFL